MLPGAGKTPNWMGELVTIDVKYIGDDIHLSVWDEDPGKDDLIGEAEIKTSSMCVGHGIDEWYKVFFKGRECGVIHLRSVWEPRGGILVEKPIGVAQPVLIHTDGQIAGRQVSATIAVQPQMQQPMMGGYPQQQPMGGFPQQQPMGGYPQQQPMGGYPQQQPMGGYPQQQPMGGYPQ